MCGVEHLVGDCPIWSRVLEALKEHRIEPAETKRLREQVMNWRSAPRFLRRQSITWNPARTYASAMSVVYEVIGIAVGASTIVASCKWPFDVGAFGMVSGVEPLVVPLIRVPRAVAYSWQRAKVFGDRIEPQPMPRFGSTRRRAGSHATCRRTRHANDGANPIPTSAL